MDTLGKEKADVTHIKHNLNPQDARTIQTMSLPKADMEGDWKTWISKNLQSKKCNKLMGRQSKATNSILKAIMGDEDILSQSTPKRTYANVLLSQKAFHHKTSRQMRGHIHTMTTLRKNRLVWKVYT